MPKDETVLEPGSCYSYHTPEKEKFIYGELAKQDPKNVKIFWRGPYHPRKLAQFDKSSITWITSEVDRRYNYHTLHPSDLANLNMELCDRQKLKPEIKYLNFSRGAIDCMIAYSGYDPILRFFSVLGDRVEQSECIETVDIDPKVFEGKRYFDLIKNGKFTELDVTERKPEQNSKNQ